MPNYNAAERVRQRIQEWTTREGHGSKKMLAAAVMSKYGDTKSLSWVTDLLRISGKKKSDLRLRDLDDVAEALGIPPGDLVRRPNDHYLEVTPTEMRLLHHFRSLPDAIRQHMIASMDYLFGFHERSLREQAAERDRRTQLAKETRLAKKA